MAPKGKSTTSTKRKTRTSKTTPWDSNNPQNWTIQQLKSELEKLNIHGSFTGMSKIALRNLYLENVNRHREVSVTASQSESVTPANITNTSADEVLDTTNNSSLDACALDISDVELLSDAEHSAHSSQTVCDQSAQPTGSQSATSRRRDSNMAAPSVDNNQEIQQLQKTVIELQQTMIAMMSSQTTAKESVPESSSGYTLATALEALRNTGDCTANVASASTSTAGEIQTTSPIGLQVPTRGSSPFRGLVELQPVIENLWNAAIAPSTRTTYQTGFNFFIRFLLMTGVIASAGALDIQVTEDLLIYFAAHCFNSKLSHNTVKLYLCGIRFMCLQQNIAYPVAKDMPRLFSVLNGIKRSQAKPTRPRHPITFNILKEVCVFLRKTTHRLFDDVLLETVCIVAFFGFLRCGEFTVKSKFDSSIHLCVKDLAILQDCVILTLKCSKTDPFRKGIAIKLFKTDNYICPYNACRQYITARLQQNPSPLDPLFANHDGNALSRNTFLARFKHTLKCVGINPDMYNGHSFRIGAATTAAAVQVEDHMIKVLGRWSSDAYCRYIRTPQDSIRKAQRSMAFACR
ncbi:uncharacterized protein LOC110447193 [Mizuhopecten yessoensis]|uniref:uncharacterized protein LOC110447193 n=1 Tax=Mizuhopecten yessoensis TaxID=6573 RepID=UPI000B457AEA|nr:uncharacterized protein LOC110447193 [Mizuhopecten yessoensis]